MSKKARSPISQNQQVKVVMGKQYRTQNQQTTTKNKKK